MDLGVDPDTLLEWLQSGMGEDREIQLTALDQLCMLLLMSDNIDRCFESCPPRTFLPALCRIFLDETAPDHILEVTARAITYYLDVSNECTRRIVQVDGAVKAICNRLAAADMNDRTSRDLAEQCIKVLEFICQRETGSVFEAGGLQCVLSFVRNQGTVVHKDTLHSAMSVVTRLCGKVEPASLPAVADCAAHLSALLNSPDGRVAEAALRCFATLTDRFLRRNQDPVTLDEHGNLVHQLLTALIDYGRNGATNVQPASVATASGGGEGDSSAADTSVSTAAVVGSASASRPTEVKSSASISLIISLLSNLLRGSAEITEKIQRCPLLVPALTSALLTREERCCLDSLRFADLVLTLLCEGRAALPKSALSVGSGTAASARGVVVNGSGVATVEYDRTHRQLIDSIRQKDTNALVEAVESGNVEVNFTDDVGQTLLNWAAAFGTVEMVQYLCEKGADVNKGQRSSSLHYASCFGRPEIGRLLLSHGANPDLRDEEGRTALEKARERNDDGHRQMAALLESPHFGLPPASSLNGQQTDRPSADEQSPTDEQSGAEGESDESAKRGGDADPELVRDFVERMLPTFVRLFHRSYAAAAVRRAAVSLSCKTMHYASAESIVRLAGSDDDGKLAERLLHMIGAVLDSADDTEGHYQVLMALKDLLEKAVDVWLPQVVRLGTFVKVAQICQLDDDGLASARAPTGDILAVVRKPFDCTRASSTQQTQSEDSSTMETGRNYRWKDWRLTRSRDSLFVWCDACALEFSNGSNGWFRFLLDGRLQTMYSSGSAEDGGSGASADAKNDFCDKLTRARAAPPTGTPLYSVFSRPTPEITIQVGNWTVESTTDGELQLLNVDAGGSQRLTLREELAGFIFESNRHTRHCFTADAGLGAPFVTGWMAKGGRRLRFKTEAQKQKVVDLARELWEKYLREAQAKPRLSLVKLREATERVEQIVQQLQADGSGDCPTKAEIRAALWSLRDLLVDDRLLSTYELATSGLVHALKQMLAHALTDTHDFVEAFGSPMAVSSIEDVAADTTTPAAVGLTSSVSVDGTKSPLSLLVERLVSVLEAVERLPQHLFDAPGGTAFGLQLLSRKLKFRLEYTKPLQEGEECVLLDRNGRSLKAEPLATVGQLKNHLVRILQKQWYDYPRHTYHFLKQVNESAGGVELRAYETDFDTNGIVYWLGTNGGTATHWTNPVGIGVAHVSCSDGPNQPYGRPDDLLSRDSNALNCHTNDDRNAWFIIDLGVYLIPSAYTLRHARGYGKSALRSWLFQGSRNGKNWLTIKSHADDRSLVDPGSTATWQLNFPVTEESVRFLRIMQNGKNSSNQTHYVSLSGFEVYGTVTEVIGPEFETTTPECILPKAQQQHKGKSTPLKQTTRGMLRQRLSGGSHVGGRTRTISIGTRVNRGIDWKWGSSPDGSSADQEGTIVSEVANGWVDVQWADGSTNSYRFGADGKYDVVEAPLSMGGVGDRSFESTSSNTSTTTTTAAAKSAATRPCTTVMEELQRTKPLVRGRGRHRQQATPPQPQPTVGQERRLSSGQTAAHQQGSRPPPSPAAGRLSRFNNKMPDAQSTASTTVTNNATTQIQQKSMSTTNLFDPLQSSSAGMMGNGGRASVASCTQAAASAESLQHQTPSLENLLARSRIYDERIPETDSTTTASEVNSDSVQTLDSVPEQDDVSTSDVQLLTAAATNMGGGSQPALTLSIDRESVEKEGRGRRATTDTEWSLDETDDTCWSAVEHQIVEDLVSHATVEAALHAEAHPDVVTPSQEDTIDVVKADFSSDKRQTSFDKMFATFDASGGVGEASTPTVEATASASLSLLEQENNAKNLANLSVSAPNISATTTTTAAAVTTPVATVVSTGSSFVAHGEPVTLSSATETRGASQPPPSSQQTLVFAPADTYGELLEMYAQVVRDRHMLQQQRSGGNTAAIGDQADALLSRLVRQAISSSVARGDASSNDAAPNEGRQRYRLLVSKPTTAADSSAQPATFRAIVQRITEGGTRALSSDDDYYHALVEGLSGREIVGPLDDEETTCGEEEDEDDECDNDDDCDDDDALMAAATLRRSQHPPPIDTDAAGRRQHSAACHNDGKLDWRQLVADEMRMAASGTRGGCSCASASKAAPSRQWDDDFVLRRRFSALIPAFDPRPGRPNVPQTEEVQLPDVDTDDEPSTSASGAPLAKRAKSSSVASGGGCSKEKSASAEPNVAPSSMVLSLDGPNLPGVTNVSVPLDTEDASLLHYVQRLIQQVDLGAKADKSRRIWEPTYTLRYGNHNGSAIEDDEDEGEGAECRTTAGGDMTASGQACTMDGVLGVLTALFSIVRRYGGVSGGSPFVSRRVTQKLLQQLHDPLVVSARALPSWCDRLMYAQPYLFSLDTRRTYLHATAFGTSRAIVWLQSQRDRLLEQSRGTGANGTTAGSGMAGSRREDHYVEYRVGRIKHERVRVPRDDRRLLAFAARLLDFHAARKTILEIEYEGEEGTGLGPTLEFYALVAAELQRKALAMWLCDDEHEEMKQKEKQQEDDNTVVGVGGVKPIGYYVRRQSAGLFPAPLPQAHPQCDEVVKLFRCLGIFVAKVLQDQRLVDLPLSSQLLTLLLADDNAELTLSDLEKLLPIKGRFLSRLNSFAEERCRIVSDSTISESERKRRLTELTLELDNGQRCSVDDLGLTFRLNPGSKVFHFHHYDLLPDGDTVSVTSENAAEYVRLCMQFYGGATGIQRQLNAIRDGFNAVFPLNKLRAFSPDEILTLVCGEQSPTWTIEELMEFTEPKLGFTRESAGFLHFVRVLADMDANERKAFLQFTTGCSSLPPGGLANLNPRLTVVHKVDASDRSYPSVNTCMHYLKLPEYSSEEILRERLLAATFEKGFHLN